MISIEQMLEEGLPFPSQSLETGDNPTLALVVLQASLLLLGTCQKLFSGLQGSYIQVIKSSSTLVTETIVYLDVDLW